MVERIISACHFSPPPASRSVSYEIAARHIIKPLQQGELDCFCGIYAAINAVRLALASSAKPIFRKDCHELFAVAAKFVANKDASEALTWGLALRRRLALTKLIVAEASRLGSSLAIERPNYRRWTSTEDAFGWIEESLALGMPVLAYLAEDPDHYTVIAGITPTTIHLFDSVGMKLIRRKHVSLSSGRRILWPPGLLRLAHERGS